MSMNKEESIIVRMTKEDKDTILTNAEKNGMKLSEYIRYVALHTKEIKIEVKIK